MSTVTRCLKILFRLLLYLNYLVYVPILIYSMLLLCLGACHVRGALQVYRFID